MIAPPEVRLVDGKPHHLPARAREILQHYLANPQAADDLEGIAHWRLLDDFVQRRVEETSAALEWLVNQGVLTRTASPLTPPVYRLNREAITEAERLLDDADSEPRRDRERG